MPVNRTVQGALAWFGWLDFMLVGSGNLEAHFRMANFHTFKFQFSYFQFSVIIRKGENINKLNYGKIVDNIVDGLLAE